MRAGTSKRSYTAATFAVILAALIALALLLSVQLTAQAQEADPDQLAEGAAIYEQNCAVCHGPQGEGRVGASLAKAWPSIRPDLTVRSIIERGVPGTNMPAWGQTFGGPLDDGQVDALVAYILSWQTGEAPQIPTAPPSTPLPPITPIPDVEGDPNNGALLYIDNCAVCHGDMGEGRIGATLAKSWAGVRTDLLIRNSIANGVPNATMPAWSQANGGPLSEDEIDDLVSYILSWDNPNAQVQPTVVVDEPSQSPWLRGVGGVVVFVVLLAVVLGGIYWLQGRGKEPEEAEE
jgi:mono/diheme cytochrome c family protein